MSIEEKFKDNREDASWSQAQIMYCNCASTHHVKLFYKKFTARRLFPLLSR